MEITYKIQNHPTFQEVILELCKKNSIREVERKANLSHGTLNKLLNNPKYNMTSKNIEKIITAFNLSPKNVGIKSEQKSKFSARLQILLDEQNLNSKELSEKIGISEGTISNWITDKSKPNPISIELTANTLGVSTSYLIGDTDVRTADYQVISEETGIKDTTFNSWKDLKNEKSYLNREQNILFEEFGINRDDVINFISTDTQLIDMFMLEASRIMSYHTSKNFQTDFNFLFNETKDSETYIENGEVFSEPLKTPYQVTIETFAKSILSKKIGLMLDDYVEKKFKEKNLWKRDFEREEVENYLKKKSGKS